MHVWDGVSTEDELRKKIYSACMWHHPMSWILRMNKKKKEEIQLISDILVPEISALVGCEQAAHALIAMTLTKTVLSPPYLTLYFQTTSQY